MDGSKTNWDFSYGPWFSMHIRIRSILKICWKNLRMIQKKGLCMIGSSSSRFFRISLETSLSIKQRIYWRSIINIKNGYMKRTRCSNSLLKEIIIDWSGVISGSISLSSRKENILELLNSVEKDGWIISILLNWKSIGKMRKILFWFSMLNSMERNGQLYRRS